MNINADVKINVQQYYNSFRARMFFHTQDIKFVYEYASALFILYKPAECLRQRIHRTSSVESGIDKILSMRMLVVGEMFVDDSDVFPAVRAGRFA